MLEPLCFTLNVFQVGEDWWYRIGNGTIQDVGKAPSRGSALQAGYQALLDMIKLTINK